MNATTQSKLMNAPRTGWLFAFPAAFLMFLFIVVPFCLAFWFSFTNQRFVSPNAAEYIGLQNFRDLLSVSVLTLEPERDAATNEILKEPDGSTKYPTVRSFTRTTRNSRNTRACVNGSRGGLVKTRKSCSPAIWCS